MKRFEYLKTLSGLKNEILSRFDENIGCWTFSDVMEASIPSCWITAETLYNLLAYDAKLLQDTKVQRAFNFLEDEFISAGVKAGGWYSYKIWPKIMSEPTLWTIRVLNRWKPDSPLIMLGINWLINNFNKSDGGCGSYPEQISRTYTTAFSLLCLSECKSNKFVQADQDICTEINQTILRARKWLICQYSRVLGSWGECQNGQHNAASTVHALIGLLSVIDHDEEAGKFLKTYSTKILDKLVTWRTFEGGWQREVESFVVGEGRQSFIQRSLWSPTMHGCVSFFELCKYMNLITNYVGVIFDLEQAILKVIQREGKIPTFELTQALWAINEVSPELEGEYVNSHVPDLTSSPLVAIGPGLYVSVRLGFIFVSILYLLALTGIALSINQSVFLLFFTACCSFLFINSVNRYNILNQKIIRNWWINILLYVVQIGFFVYSGSAIFKYFVPDKDVAAYISASTFTLIFIFQEYIKKLLLRIKLYGD